MRRAYISLVLALCCLVGCGKPAVINGGNPIDFEKSYADLTATMSAGEKEQFDAAIAKIMEHYTKEYARKVKNPRDARDLARMELSNLTSSQIIKKADGLR